MKAICIAMMLALAGCAGVDTRESDDSPHCSGITLSKTKGKSRAPECIF